MTFVNIIGDVGHSTRHLVRASNGIVWAVSMVTGEVAVSESDAVTPTSFTERDSGNRPNGEGTSHVACAIDSNDNIHIAYWSQASMGGGQRYVLFNTGTKTYGTTELVDGAASGFPSGRPYCSIAVDQNDVPHISYDDFTANMGSDYRTVLYNNRIGGSWINSSEVIAGANLEENAGFSEINICFPTDAIGENRPVICWIDPSRLGCTHGDALDPSSFVTVIDVAGGQNPAFAQRPTLCNSDNNTLGIARNGTFYEHLPSDIFATWQSGVSTTGGANYNSIGSRNGFFYVASNAPTSGRRVSDNETGSWSTSSLPDNGQSGDLYWANNHYNPENGILDINYNAGSLSNARYTSFVIEDDPAGVGDPEYAAIID